jgi:hypothetical protein
VKTAVWILISQKPKLQGIFVIAFLTAKYSNVVNKVVDKTFKSIPTHFGTLHCNKENNKTRIKLLAELKG